MYICINIRVFSHSADAVITGDTYMHVYDTYIRMHVHIQTHTHIFSAVTVKVDDTAAVEADRDAAFIFQVRTYTYNVVYINIYTHAFT